MKRLIYAPKVWIFIRSSNLDGTILDVSSDIVRGSVTQKLGDVSTAQFELRNRYQKWLRTKKRSIDSQGGISTDNRIIFLPMDLITIWMQRIAGRPVQVFTGYLDSVPYYQSYPGNALFTASCTIKKMAYNWFDPGLPTFWDWVKDTPGWIVDFETGEFTNPGAVFQGHVVGDALEEGLKMNEAGFSDLLGRFLVEIAGWSPSDVIISGMNPEISDQAAKLFTKIDTRTKKNLKELGEFMQQYLGILGYTGEDLSLTDGSEESKGGASGGRGTSGGYGEGSRAVESSSGVPTKAPATRVAQDLRDVADNHNLPPEMLVFGALIYTRLDPHYNKPQETGDNRWGFGMFAQRPGGPVPEEKMYGPTSQIMPPTRQMEVDGVAITDLIQDYSIAADVFAKRLNSAAAQGSWTSLAKRGDVASMVKWMEKANGYTIISNGDYGTLYAQAQQLVGSGITRMPWDTPSLDIDAFNTSVAERIVTDVLDIQEQSVVSSFYQDADPSISKAILKAKNVSSNLKVSSLPGLRSNQVFISGNPQDLANLYNSMKGDKSNAIVQASIKGQDFVLRNGTPSQLPDKGTLYGNGIVITTQTIDPAEHGRGEGAAGATAQSSQTSASDVGGDVGEEDARINPGPEGTLTLKELAAF